MSDCGGVLDDLHSTKICPCSWMWNFCTSTATLLSKPTYFAVPVIRCGRMKVILIRIEIKLICFCPCNNTKLRRLKFEVTAIYKNCKKILNLCTSLALPQTEGNRSEVFSSSLLR